MSDDDNEKDATAFALTAPATGLQRTRRKPDPPTLVKVGNRWATSDGRYHSFLVADYASEHGLKRWLEVNELSKIFATRTNDGKQRIRKNMVKVFDHCLARGQFLLYETNRRGRIDAVKMLDVTSRVEWEAAGPQLDRMKKRRELTTEKHEKALQVLAIYGQQLLPTEPADESSTRPDDPHPAA